MYTQIYKYIECNSSIIGKLYLEFRCTPIEKMRDVKVIIVNFQKLLITKHIYLLWHGRPIGNSRKKK